MTKSKTARTSRKAAAGKSRDEPMRSAKTPVRAVAKKSTKTAAKKLAPKALAAATTTRSKTAPGKTGRAAPRATTGGASRSPTRSPARSSTRSVASHATTKAPSKTAKKAVAPTSLSEHISGAIDRFTSFVSGKPSAHSGLRRRKLDPFLAREAERYDDPLPSREFILQVLAEEGLPLEEQMLARLVGIKKHEIDSFARRLGAMERDGQLLRNRKGALLVAEKLDLVAGHIEGHPDGYGFLVPDSPGGEKARARRGEDFYVNAKEMRKVMHGDRVMGRPGGVDRRGRREAEIVEVLERANPTLVGRLMSEHGVFTVKPSERKIGQNILIPSAAVGKASAGEVVIVEITDPPSSHSQPMGRVIEVLGRSTDPGMEIEIALRKHKLPFAFSAEVERQAARIPDQPSSADYAGRTDLRQMPLVTIDGETARDFDDAVYCEAQDQGFRLLVAIADVSHYVQPGTPLDKEAIERGTSVYFPRRVIPMLPEKLSNGLCSINPDVDRLCMVCDMSINAAGEVRRYRFYEAVMRSQARLTYNQVWDALSDPRGEEARRIATARPLVMRNLLSLHQVFKALLQARGRRGAIDFETSETRFLFDHEGKIDRIVPTERNDAHRLIEECMLAANVSAAEFLQQSGQGALYRVHEGPTAEKLAALREFFKGFGLHLQGGDKPSAKDYAALLKQIKPRPDMELLQTVMLRSLQQAQYSPENVGHFGLSYEGYTHFTSPIRRYPDLLVHRAIRAVLRKQRYQPAGMSWAALGEHCSMTERRADEASREVEQWLKCWYMRDRVGEEFDGRINSVTAFGIFVGLDELHVEGLVHVSELGTDYFRFEAAKHEMVGERTGRRFRLADQVRVRIARVDLETSRIEFMLAGEKQGRVSPLHTARAVPVPRGPRRKR